MPHSQPEQFYRSLPCPTLNLNNFTVRYHAPLSTWTILPFFTMPHSQPEQFYRSILPFSSCSSFRLFIFSPVFDEVLLSVVIPCNHTTVRGLEKAEYVDSDFLSVSPYTVIRIVIADKLLALQIQLSRSNCAISCRSNQHKVYVLPIYVELGDFGVNSNEVSLHKILWT